MAVLLAAGTAAALLVDLPVASWLLRQDALPGDVRKMVNICEVFGFGGGVALICLTVWTLDRPGRRKAPRLLACAFVSGGAASFAKLILVRTRPYAFDFQGGVFDTFGPWLPALRGMSEALHHSSQSIPSGHTATAVGLAVALGWMYPQGRLLFALFALLAAFQRLSSGAHYLSDTLAGAAIACLICGACLSRSFPGGLFDSMEGRNRTIESKVKRRHLRGAAGVLR